jgi:protein gp37
MYEGVKTINFLAGKCPHDCVYCSSKSFRYDAQKKKYSGELRLDENAFKKNLGHGNIWFVCAQNDLFANGVPEDFIHRIYNQIEKYPDNIYWFQSKNPKKMYEWARSHYVYGTTIETNRDYDLSVAPKVEERIEYMARLRSRADKTFITIEPIADFGVKPLLRLISGANPDWVNIGADSKRHGLPEPSKSEILELIKRLKEFTEVRQKTNLGRLLK